MTQFSDGVRQGSAYWPTALSPNTAGERQDLGVQLPSLQIVAFPTASTAATNNIVSASATTTAVNLTATGALVSGSIATLDYPRCLSLTATADLSYAAITITGTDKYGQTLKVTKTLPNATQSITLSAFKTASVFAWAATASAIAPLYIGSSNTFGLPYVLTNTYDALGEYVDGAGTLSAPTFTAGLATSVTVTATTGDVRGTVALATNSLPDGSKNIAVLMHVYPGISNATDVATATHLYGLTPFAG
jgi:hypothetical protein